MFSDKRERWVLVGSPILNVWRKIWADTQKILHLFFHFVFTITHSLHNAEKKSVLIVFNTRAAHGKYIKATTFKWTVLIQHLIKCT